MKTIYYFRMLCALFIISSSFSVKAQNVYPWPSTGNIGIGTTSTGYPLDVVSHNDYYVARFLRGTGGTGDQSAIVDVQNGGGTLWRYGVGGTGNGFGLTAGQFYLERYGSGVFMLFNSSGNLGIGTSSPTSRLHVSGGGSSNIDFRVNGRLLTGDANNAGGVWLNSGTTQFVGQYDATRLGLWNSGWALLVANNGNVLINKTSQANTVYKLDVGGSVRANEVVVNTTGADFVFEDNYKLRPLNEVENYIKENNHLPEVPSATEMNEEGMKVGELSTTLLQKVEELTLYMIELKKENELLKAKIEALEKQK